MFMRIYLCQENNAKIFDGSQASNDTFPWMVSLRLSYSNILIHLCGGTILSDVFVLTAASCFQRLTIFPILFSVKAGITTISNETDPTEQLRTLSQIILHPNYSAENFRNNIALARVSLPFNLKDLRVSPIALSNLTSLENVDLTTIGWGSSDIQPNSTVRSIALEQITVQENVQCTKNSIDPSTQLCARGRL